MLCQAFVGFKLDEVGIVLESTPVTLTLGLLLVDGKDVLMEAEVHQELFWAEGTFDEAPFLDTPVPKRLLDFGNDDSWSPLNSALLWNLGNKGSRTRSPYFPFRRNHFLCYLCKQNQSNRD